ncbi:hypothetical protein Bpfe_009212 [Biomphalaria pfeifferi]|uniref:Uncharacterized protein n=1 Tax=Biomphalaria pfeifferi TaxID=112525 RepID=A0AAD8BV44_BIOPF|nr:hypothetical protein Bpfe_009212 [Biomphalaria pfeifferi]
MFRFQDLVFIGISYCFTNAMEWNTGPDFVYRTDVTEGQNLTFQCQRTGYWHVTLIGHRLKTVSTRDYKSQGPWNYYPDKYFAEWIPPFNSVLHVYNVGRDVYSIGCTYTVWIIGKWPDNSVSINLTDYEITPFLTVSPKSNVTFMCSSDIDLQKPLILYKNDRRNVLKTSTSGALNITMTHFQCGTSFVVGCSKEGYTLPGRTMQVNVECLVRLTVTSDLDDVHGLISPRATLTLACASDMPRLLILYSDTVSNVLRTSSSDSLNYTISDLECGSSFLAGCYVPRTSLLHSRTTVYVRDCEAGDLDFKLNNNVIFNPDCLHNNVNVFCRYSGSRWFLHYVYIQYQGVEKVLYYSYDCINYSFTFDYKNFSDYFYPDLQVPGSLTFTLGCGLRKLPAKNQSYTLQFLNCSSSLTVATEKTVSFGVALGLSLGAIVAVCIIILVIFYAVRCSRAKGGCRRTMQTTSGNQEPTERNSHPPAYSETFTDLDEPPPPYTEQ